MSGQGRSVEVLLAGDGDVVRFDQDGARLEGKAPAGRVLIDMTRTGEVGDEVLRDRRNVAAEGIVVAVLAINRQTGALVGEPEIIPRGFVVDREGDALFREAVLVLRESVASTSVEERADQGLMTEKIRVELRRFFKRRSGRRPLVLPVLMEI
jgi:ribonuclease J